MVKIIMCQNCHGTGKQGIPPDETDCERCDGVGEINADGFIGNIKERVELFANLSPTCKVASCIDFTEYAALTDAQKDKVKIVLSCGFVDMRDGQWTRTILFTIFNEASATRIALIAMFG